ncbi:MAG: DUF2167 domain-containing protein [Novosphingobium sp.]
MAKVRFLIAAGLLALVPLNLNAQAPAPQVNVQSLVKGLKPQHGKIALPAAKASLDLGNDYDFYGPEDTRTILVDIWGNPPSEAEGLLGMFMKAGASPLKDNWGAIVTYEASGYVADDDAASTDYAEVLKQMQDGEADVNAQRQSSGYPTLHVVGWAESPVYDKASHSMVWARDIKFSDTSVDTLNYDVRSLGRAGVLSVNMISSMPHLAEVKAAAHEFAGHASFDAGSRYTDFNPDMDKKAEYGVGGLVAAGAGLVIAKKLGLLAIVGKFLVSFLKPLLVGIAAMFAAFKNRIMGLFGRKTDPLEGGD